jgi:UDP-N-acetylmuramyl pentapeptide synthase
VVLFDTAYAAATTLADLVAPGDVILVKGSQSVRTERVVEALLADPADASLLVRQEKKWREKK